MESKRERGVVETRLPATSEPAAARDVRLDALRGLLLVIMTINHAVPLGAYTFQTFGYVSSLEGFLYLSGIVAGIVYSRPSSVARGPWRRVSKRVLAIYGYHVVGFAVLLAAAHVVPAVTTLLIGYWRQPGWLGPLAESPWEALVRLGSLTYQPTYFHVLPLYMLLVLCIPAAVQAARRGYAWLALAASFSLWLAVQCGLDLGVEQLLDDREAGALGNFNVLSWQFVFTVGVVAGCWCHRHRGAGTRLVGTRLFALALPVAILLLVAKHLHAYPDQQLSYWVSITDLGAVRLVNFGALACVVAYLAGRRPAWFRNRWLALLGRHSIKVFTYHVVIVYLLLPFSWRPGGLGKLALAALVVASLTLPARLAERLDRRRRERLP